MRRAHARLSAALLSAALLSGALLLAACSSTPAAGPAGVPDTGSSPVAGQAVTPSAATSAGPSGAPGAQASGGAVAGSAQPSASPTVAPVIVPAKVGHCFAYTSLDHWVLDEAKAVPCSKKHTAQTVYVGQLTDPAAISFEEAGRISAAATKAGSLRKLPAEDQAKWAGYVSSLAPLTSACEAAISKTVRSRKAGVVTSTLFVPDFTGPTQAEWDKGARWVRCNVVAQLVADDYGASQALLRLPQKLATALDTKRFRNCWIPLEQGDKARSVSCTSKVAKRGAWLTVSDLIPTGRSAYPGQRGALDIAKGKCLSLLSHVANTSKPTARWWTWHINGNGAPRSGVTKATWGTRDAHIGCALPSWQFRT